jgi:hypothetical protein
MLGKKVGDQPVDELCRKCGVTAEGYFTQPMSEADTDIFMKHFISELKADRDKKTAFLASAAYSGPYEEQPERTWPNTEVRSTTRTGVRSAVPARFIADSVVQTKLGCLPEEVPGVQRMRLRNEFFEFEDGIAVPDKLLPDDVRSKSRPCEVFCETTVEIIEHTLPHEETIRARHASDRMKYCTKLLHGSNPGTLKFEGGVFQTWDAVAGMIKKVQDERAALAASRASGGKGGTGQPEVVRRASTLHSEGSMLAPPVPIVKQTTGSVAARTQRAGSGAARLGASGGGPSTMSAGSSGGPSRLTARALSSIGGFVPSGQLSIAASSTAGPQVPGSSASVVSGVGGGASQIGFEGGSRVGPGSEDRAACTARAFTNSHHVCEGHSRTPHVI